MAISNGKFKSAIGGKYIWDYITTYRGDCDKSMTIEELQNELHKREYELWKVLNMNDKTNWSNDEFWEEIWDKACCKANINTESPLWSETNVASKLESLGSYLLAPYEIMLKKIDEENGEKVIWNHSRAKELELDDKVFNYNDVANDKNYRLAPKESIKSEDLNHRKMYSRDYDYYVNTYYPKIDKALRKKIEKDLKNRYGYCDGKLEYTPYELKDYDTWSKIKEKEKIKSELLNDAQDNLDILLNQMKKMKEGEQLLFNENADFRGNIKVHKYEEEDRIIKLSKQLERFGLNNDKIKEIENSTYKDIDRRVNVNLNHLTSNIGDVKDYMIRAKLAYTNRVFINPPKCPNVKHALDLVDYTNVNHIKALLYMPENNSIDPFDYLSPLTYDVTQMVKKLHKQGILSDRDIYIIEGMRFNISQEQLADELGVTQPTISSAINRIVKNVTQGFIDDEEDLLYLNVLKGEYKKCSKCGEVKLINKFNKNSRRKDGLETFCKVCQCK